VLAESSAYVKHYAAEDQKAGADHEPIPRLTSTVIAFEYGANR